MCEHLSCINLKKLQHASDCKYVRCLLGILQYVCHSVPKEMRHLCCMLLPWEGIACSYACSYSMIVKAISVEFGPAVMIVSAWPCVRICWSMHEMILFAEP